MNATKRAPATRGTRGIKAAFFAANAALPTTAAGPAALLTALRGLIAWSKDRYE